MSKYFNKEIIRGLEKRSNLRRFGQLEINSPLPEGNEFLLFVSNDPQAKVSRSVIRRTVQNICSDAIPGKRFVVSIERTNHKPNESESVAQPSNQIIVERSASSKIAKRTNCDMDSGDNPIIGRSPNEQRLSDHPRILSSKQELVETYSFNDLFESDSDSATQGTSVHGSQLAAEYRKYRLRQQMLATLRSVFAPTGIMRKLRSAVRDFVRLTFGRAAPAEYLHEALLSPTLFGPSPDEPLVALADHIYRAICWLLEYEQVSLQTRRLRNKRELIIQ